MDVGEGATRSLKKLNIDFHSIKRILISHTHLDHIGGIGSLIWSMWIDYNRNEPLEIFCPIEGENIIISFLRITGTPFERLPFELVFKELEGGEKFDCIQTVKTNHPLPCIAYRINKKSSCCYSGDTSPSEKIAQLSKKCDVLIHEAVFPNDMVDLAHKLGHSTPYDAGVIAKKADVKKLVLFHYANIFEGNEKKLIEQAKTSFDGEILVAKDLWSINL